MALAIGAMGKSQKNGEKYGLPGLVMTNGSPWLSHGP